MPGLPLTDFHDLWIVKGAGSPVSDEAPGGRDLSLSAGATPPRGTSYRGRRGAEFRTSGFAATAPACFATASPGTFHTSLVVSSKIQSFTLWGWFKPQKTGVTAVNLTPVGGLFSATNMGATPWAFDQPCFIFTPGTAGASRLVVSLFGSVLDTRDASQTYGPTDTTPVDDNDWNFVAVRVTGSSSVNNQVDAIDVVHVTRQGVVRVYTLGERKASCSVRMPTNPTDGQTVTIDGRAYTFRATLVGTANQTRFPYGGSGNFSDGDTITVGQDSEGNPIVYTMRAYIGAGQAATCVLEAEATCPASTSKYKTRINVGGHAVTILWGAKNADGAPAGGFSIGKGGGDNVAAVLFKCLHGDYDGIRYFKTPAPPATGEFDAGRTWTTRRVVPGDAASLFADYVAGSREIPLRVLDAGSAGNACKVSVLEPDTAGNYTLPCDAARNGRNSPYQVRLKASGAALTPTAGGAGSVANGTYKWAVTFVHASGESPPTTPATLVVAGGPRAVDLSAIPLGPTGTTARKVYRTKAGGSVYYLLTTIADNTTTTYSDTTADASLSTTEMPSVFYMVGGLSAASTRTVLIGGSYATSLSNLIKAINATGTPGTEYSSDITTANPTWTASASGNDLLLTSKHSGSAGNGKPASESTTVLGAAVVDVTGVDGGTADEVKIGSTPAASIQNLVDAINLEGSPGLQYGDPTTVNLDVEAEESSDSFRLTSLAAGTGGNGVTVATTVTGATVKDEFNDKTVSALHNGQAAPPFTVPSGARPDQSDLRFLWGGWNQSAASTAGIFYGVASDAGIANRVLSLEEVRLLAFGPPPVSARDRGWYRAAHRTRISFKTDRQAAWPVYRDLAEGSSSQRVPLQSRGQRGALRIVGVEPGRPFMVDRVNLLLDHEDGALGSGIVPLIVPARSGGLDRAGPPSKIDPTASPNLRNITYEGGRQRRRRGYAILNNASTSTTAAVCAFFDATNAAGDIYQLALVDGTLYLFDNGELIELDTGWPQDEIPTVATVGLKTFIFTKSRRKVFVQGSILDLGVTAPTEAPRFVEATPNTNGGVIALTPGYEYCYTFYDGTKLTESGPSPTTLVMLPAGSSPSTIELYLSTSGSSSVTKRVVYRRKSGTETWFKVGEVDDNTTTAFEDESEVPTDSDILDAPRGFFTTAEVPSASSCAVHEGRLVLYRDDDDTRTYHISEVGDGERWNILNQFTAESEMRSVQSFGGRLILLTDRTVEVVEGDWVRGSSGLLGVARRVIDTSKGCYGPHAADSGLGGVYWADPTGLHTLGRSTDARDAVRTVSEKMHPAFQQAVDTAGTNVVVTFNPVTKELWTLLSKANPGDSEQDPKNRVVVVLNLENRRWSEYDLALSWARRINDGVFGIRFIGCDYYGNIVDLETYDGDGLQGNEAALPASKVATAVSLTAKTFTISAAAFPTDGSWRGVAAVLEDVSTGEFYRTIILSCTATVLTLASVPTWLAIGDKVHVGGIVGLDETAEFDGGTPTEKVFLGLEMSFADATEGRY